ncbi:uncharacterized protein N7511_010094 [Penicillium nucicola]|uniref:uncharacterized protein n=1 Tax=Penicillium nucicola TaxID=1850975 RepID=UPI002544FD57|nr:uncharacterized protein N7511_010094 [Penicillium nucicola]KAJ5748398.1 hypothetical protein N7511_010094 [Penicillium nucicola]
MVNLRNIASSSLDAAPPPPPPPTNPNTKISPSVLKLKTISPDSVLFAPTPKTRKPAPTGQYFFYGTLQHPTLLKNILDLSENPVLRPAYLDGYKTKLWGSYPALLPGRPHDTVQGSIYEVMCVEHAERLANYETNSYATQTCEVRFGEDKNSVYTEGVCFLFVGNERDLVEGGFDLQQCKGLHN